MKHNKKVKPLFPLSNSKRRASFLLDFDTFVQSVVGKKATTTGGAVQILSKKDYSKFRLVSEQGNCGEVFLATDNTTNETRVLKKLDGGRKGFLGLAERELAAYTCEGVANSPSVARFHGLIIDDVCGCVYFVLEHLSGGSLKGRQISCERTIAKIIISVATGLRDMHELSELVHGDIKPENLILAEPREDDEEGDCRVIDFGCAQKGPIVDVDMGHTMEYVSPERRFGPFSYGADIYAFGKTLLEVALVNTEWEFAEEFQDLVARCMAEDPETRISAAELLEHEFLKKVTFQ
eukprot:TRINITY_DN12547_c0_g1_i1.p1 TRINITY_DN12547_c0_g1~~TRINITY_DN12547_c0_g1_i1.p1  ORF type:complete len:293 (-),score=73.67 TRINITY_DN12547_c0_g1_i1:427-1305(-)